MANNLNKKDLEKKIKVQIGEVEADITRLEELTKPISPENAIGRISRMDAINNKSINDNALRQARIKLEKLKLALHKLPNPEFGLCTRCKETIQEARIMLIPESTLCVNCASKR